LLALRLLVIGTPPVEAACCCRVDKDKNIRQDQFLRNERLRG
jgi:hypothetical protein